ncbi:MAG: LuxR C-terminal-related transcriptional regulator [Planctomycetales bacterium]|nr:LuxR C-terminal-related transcriptional regulator [Planctomycetales bacterium]
MRNRAINTHNSADDGPFERVLDELHRLTKSEKDVTRAYYAQPDIKQIALSRGAKPQTVRNQLASIREKLEVASNEELLRHLFELEKNVSHG